MYQISLVKLTNLNCQLFRTGIKEAERDIAHKIFSVLTDLDTFSSSFENNSDTEDPDLSQNNNNNNKKKQMKIHLI